jgi:hypothetical protein
MAPADRRGPAERIDTVTFHLGDHSLVDVSADEMLDELSACEQTGRCLWIACDETATVERLITKDWRRFGEHRAFRLGEFFDLPAGPTGRMDIEGLARDGGYLWIVGSHSLARKRPKRGTTDPEKALARLTRVKREANRYFLGRVPLARDEQPDIFRLDKRATDEDSGAVREAACVAMTDGRNALIDALADDIHFAPFLDVPAKENGFDIEGIAARRDRVFLGLRGPVLAGWAAIIELRLEAAEPGRLELRNVGPQGERYRKHFLDLNGLGIRELTFDGDDLLILTGPTMDLDGPIELFRWPKALDSEQPDAVTRNRLERVMDVPFGDRADHAEGIIFFDRPNSDPALLVIYDSPDPSRLHADAIAVDFDLFPLTRSPA